MTSPHLPEAQASRERSELLQRLEDWLDTPMLVLSFGWLALFILELTQGLTPILEGVSLTIWILFGVEFAIQLLLAPRKGVYLKTHWLNILALILPAFRTLRVVQTFRILKTARGVRGLQLLRVLIRTNQGMRSLAANFTRRGFGYVLLLSIIITLVGAAGMFAFEQETGDGAGFESYGGALWWTAMLITTMGSDYFPRTLEGRILCFMLALYAFTVFGYMTATLATFFIGQDAEDDSAELAGAHSLRALQEEVTALRSEIRALRQTLP